MALSREKTPDVVTDHTGLHGFCLLVTKKEEKRDKLGQLTATNMEVKRMCLQNNPDIIPSAPSALSYLPLLIHPHSPHIRLLIFYLLSPKEKQISILTINFHNKPFHLRVFV